MIEPRIELKCVKTFEGHEGQGLNADIWINGIKCMHVYDGAYDGAYEFTTLKTKNDKKNVLIDENIALLEKYVEQLPKEEANLGNKKVMIHYGMDVYIDRVLEKQEAAKNSLKFDKAKNIRWRLAF